jgi:hypothetical protein
VSESIPPPAPVLPATAEAVLTFLDSVGRRSEAELYVRLFRELPRESFAIIAAECRLIQKNGGAIAEQLRFLAELGLYAPVVLGLFDRGEAENATERLIRRLGAAGLSTSAYCVPELGVGAAIRSDLREGRIPVLRFGDSCPRAEERLEVLSNLITELQSRKLVLLRRLGALGATLERPIELLPNHVLPTNADGISVINLRTDYEPLCRSGLLVPEDARLLGQLSTLLSSDAQSGLQVNVTSPMAILRELFTVRGAGTFVKRGTQITAVDSYQKLDTVRLRQLLESSFHRSLVPYFFKHPILAVYHEPDYHAAAIIEPGPVAPILSKFAVDPVAQGEGMGRDIWQAFTRDFPSIIWRARSSNPICSWYAWQCDGLVRGPKWTTYFRGVDPTGIPAVIAEMLSRTEDFT